MTGTSVDAIDIAALSIDHHSYELLNAKSYKFPENLKNKILEYSRNQENIDDYKLRTLGDQLAHVYAKSIEAFKDESNLKKETINSLNLLFVLCVLRGLKICVHLRSSAVPKTQ